MTWSVVTWRSHRGTLLLLRIHICSDAASTCASAAIATSSFRESAVHHLDQHGIQDRFHHVVAHGDYAASKPAPDPYLKAAELLKTDPTCVLPLRTLTMGFALLLRPA
ncbi:HAD hydrolase-like protein [Neorhizobium alkalisoli]|uniref:HAD hydrolase-like protein n=1 Tax=Neorhizobium alkalisoli TaxID=528178 RepID=UPI001FE072CF|nr:HAD hydrolase-like protein [Neorhizobium alkalisoli]